MNFFRSISFLCVAGLLASIPQSTLAADTWRVGAASRIITPKEPMWMAGYGARNAPASGKLSDLYAKALVLEDSSKTRGVFLTLDLVGIDRQLSRLMVQAIAEKLDLPSDHVVLSTSHTHSGPVVGKNLGPMHYYQLDERSQKQIDAYADQLLVDCVELARQANDNRIDCQVSWGNGRADFATNRRNNKEPEVPKLRSMGDLTGPVDHDVPVLTARDLSGQLRAILFGYACHSTVLSGYDWSADYPGYAQQQLEQRFPGCVALFFAGCGADQNPLPRRTPALAEHYGRRLATAVEAVLITSEMKPAAPSLTCHYAEVPLPLADLPTSADLQRQQSSSNKSEATRASILLGQIESGKALSPTYPYPISLWKIGGELNLIALGGEVVVDYSLRAKTDLPNTTWVAAYSHDVMAYIPSRRVLAEGGYEGGGAMVYYGLPTIWAPEVEEIIFKTIANLNAKATQ